MAPTHIDHKEQTTEEKILQVLDRFVNALSTLNDYLREREERIILLRSPKLLQFDASDVNTWKRVAYANQYRFGYFLIPTPTSVGNAFVAPSQMERATQGVPVGTGYPRNQIDYHQGEVWVSVDVATVQLILFEWVRTPLVPKQI